MKRFDLESKVKSLRVPEREADYWEAFPKRVMTELSAAPAARPARRDFPARVTVVRPNSAGLPDVRFLLVADWGAPGPGPALRENEQEWRKSVAQLDNNLSRLMQDEHGLDHLIEDKP